MLWPELVSFIVLVSCISSRCFDVLYCELQVHGRVSDIWRSYIAQRLLWDVGSSIAFMPPRVDQFRNPLADMQAEEDLYYNL